MNFLTCANPINQLWYFLLVLVILAWAVLLMPFYSELPLMLMHGILSYAVCWGVYQAKQNDVISTFVGALSVTASVEILSLSTGRQALRDTLTGIYILLLGAYLTKGFFQAAEQEYTLNADLLFEIVIKAVIIGLGT